MSISKGFTLFEIIMAMVVVGVIVVVAIPNFETSLVNSKLQAIENNLRAIAVGEQKYNEDTGAYCFNNSASPCDTQVDINKTLSLSMVVLNDNFNYTCVNAGSATTCTALATPVCCTATNANYPTAAGTTIGVDVNGNLTCFKGVNPIACP